MSKGLEREGARERERERRRERQESDPCQKLIERIVCSCLALNRVTSISPSLGVTQKFSVSLPRTDTDKSWTMAITFCPPFEISNTVSMPFCHQH